MNIELNGETVTLESAAPLADLLDRWGFGDGIAVAINGAFVPRSTYGTTVVQAGDAVEIVAPRQGG